MATKKQIKKLDGLVKLAIKLRDHYTCQKCKLKVSGSNCHASHVVPISAGMRLRWEMWNLKVLCYHHHINWWHKNPMESGKWFEKKFPDRAKYLSIQKGLVKYTDYDLEQIENKLKDYISEVKSL